MKSLFEIAKSGLRGSQRSMSVTSNNIVNADTPGYSRQRVEKTPDGMQMDQYHGGLGVNIEQVTRLRDDINDKLLNKKQHDMGYLQKKADVYEKLEASMVTDYGDDLDTQVGSLFDNFADLASNPQDVSVRNNLISETQQLTSKLRSTSLNVDENSDLVKNFAGKTLDSINSLLNDINELNGSIKQAQAKGNPDFSSLDKRVAKMNELSELVDFESRKTSTGAMEIQIDGHSVVDENKAYNITSEVDDANKKFRLRLENGHVIEPESGKIGAEIEMYEEGIPEMKKRLDNIASTIVSEVNNIHNSGYGLEDNIQRDFFNSAGTTAESITINQDLIDNPKHIAASDTDGEAGNGEVASAIASLRNQKVIGGTSQNQTLSNYTISTISEPGVNLDAVTNKMSTRDSEIQMLKTQQEETAGVNIDEELSNMMKFQNAYQGAAKVMSSAQEMYDTLISIVR
ncbi:flagellar hook-associated protein FlgK [Fodinibius salsisoli]|uniref:Flagellar hook-associated protein 1 n=1 Tax=Fodinibius salsisoli TaxID=2820877 RepID=A0ABT3PHF8_9BACT|nr:flagellar hook-associated protein FlgK [Fodinibius salsisoli]MCW9705351.1 flagellar hook-associated protein FlgK [Fodinibius salsisoli]